MPFLQSIYCKGLWSEKIKRYNKLKIRIFCPSQVAKVHPKIFKFLVPELRKDHYNFPKLSFKEMNNAKPRAKIGKAKISVQEVIHGFGKAQSLAFRVKAGDKIFAYSGDTGDCAGVRKICKNVDLFLCESSAFIGQDEICGDYGHLTPYLAGKIAQQGKVKKLVLTHYIGLDSETAMLKDCRRSGFKGQIIIGHDFDKLGV